MKDREFKALRRTINGEAELVELSSEQLNRIPVYIKALETADKSQVPDPKFSGYFCKESIGFRTMHKAGNVEYGFCCALHGEVSGGAVLRASSDGPRGFDDQLVMGIIADDSEGGKPANPCGDCRDFMLDALGPKLEIVSGPADGGVAVVAKLSDYLFEFDGSKNFDLNPDFERNFLGVFLGGNLHVCDNYSPPDVHPERRYYACINGKYGRYYGALDLMCDYHPIYPLRDAIRQARRARDARFDSVIVVGQDVSNGLAEVPPHVMYKDRQHLMEFNLEWELLDDVEIDPPVYLARCQNGLDSTRVHHVWQTSVKEWLPFPFSPRNFGPEFVSAFTRKIKKRYQ